ncbi:UNVERIFIED_CONTAM: hypothetical protein FKN15_017865 [Acipenser sinensis]
MSGSALKTKTSCLPARQILASLPLKPPGTVDLAPSSAAWRTKIGALSAGAHGGMLPPPREKGRAACPNARQDGTACPETEEGEEWSILEESKDDDACPSAREGGAVVSRARRGGSSAISSAKGEESAVIFRVIRGEASTGARVSRATAGP